MIADIYQHIGWAVGVALLFMINCVTLFVHIRRESSFTAALHEKDEQISKLNAYIRDARKEDADLIVQLMGTLKDVTQSVESTESLQRETKQDILKKIERFEDLLQSALNRISQYAAPGSSGGQGGTNIHFSDSFGGAQTGGHGVNIDQRKNDG